MAGGANSVSPRPETPSLAPAGFGIAPVKPQAAYELAVEQIRRALALGRFSPGDRLPSERQLAQQLRVSRTVVREAIRVLEGEGMLEVTRGARGGSRVLPAGGAQRLTADELRAEIDEIKQLTDFRLAVECAAAQGAARERTDDEAGALDELVTAQEQVVSEYQMAESEDAGALLTTRFIELDHRFHLAIAAASHNHYLVEAVETARVNLHRPLGAVFAKTSRDAAIEHREIVAAIVSSDAEAAGRAMAGHIETTRTSTIDELTRPTSKRRS